QLPVTRAVDAAHPSDAEQTEDLPALGEDDAARERACLLGVLVDEGGATIGHQGLGHLAGAFGHVAILPGLGQMTCAARSGTQPRRWRGGRREARRGALWAWRWP